MNVLRGCFDEFALHRSLQRDPNSDSALLLLLLSVPLVPTRPVLSSSLVLILEDRDPMSILAGNTRSGILGITRILCCVSSSRTATTGC